MISAGIAVSIPEKCYISSDPKRTAPFEFYFHIAYGVIPEENRPPGEDSGQDETGRAQVTVKGFEKLLSEDKIEDFISSLKIVGGDDWVIQKSVFSSDIIFRYEGDILPDDFFLRASVETFICDAVTNDPVMLTVRVKNFPGTEDVEYAICTKVDYTPWARSLSASQAVVDLDGQVEISYECLGDHIDKRLYQGVEKVNTARSPYTAVIDKPTLFTLEVFNEAGMEDRTQIWVDVSPPRITSFASDRNYFSSGEEQMLTWSVASVSNIAVDGLTEGDTMGENYALVHPKASYGEKTVRYMLRAYGYKDKRPGGVSAEVFLNQSGWKNSGAVSGFFADQAAYAYENYNRHIFTYGNAYYCYANPVLYKSMDGFFFEPFSTNDTAPGSFLCLAADVFDGVLYAMGKQGKEERSLFFAMYHFGQGIWSYQSAMQTCISNHGAFSCSDGRIQYAQMCSRGIVLTSYEGGYWNDGTVSLAVPEGNTLVCGDVCCFKNQSYAAFLTDDRQLSVYCDTSENEHLLFATKLTQQESVIRFAQSENRLYVATEKTLYDVAMQRAADIFFPLQQSGYPWFGRDLQGDLFGIFPDQCRWTYEELTEFKRQGE